MANTLKIKRRAAGGAAGAPASLAAGELAYNEVDSKLYIGLTSTSIVAIGGSGAYQPLAANLTTLLGLTTGANYIITGAAGSSFDAIQLSAGTFLARASTGAMSVWAISDPALSFLGSVDTPSMRASLGVAIGTNVQAYSAKLDSLAGLTQTANYVITGGAGSTYDALQLTANTFIARGSTGTLAVKSISDQALTFMATGNLTISGTLDVSGLAVFSSTTVFNSNVSFTTTSAFTGNATFNGALISATLGTTAAKQHVIPDVASSELAILATAQTFTGQKTFSAVTTFSGNIATSGSLCSIVNTLFVQASSEVRRGFNAPQAQAANSTLTTATVLAGWCNYTGAAGTLTLPTGTQMDTATGTPSNHQMWEMIVTNTGSGTATMTAAAGFTIAATATVAAGRTVRFLIRKSAANTYILCGA